MDYREHSGGYESMTWISDRKGREFACYLRDVEHFDNFEEIPADLKEKCLDVNTLVGTERW